MGGSSKKVTVGYKYYVGMHMAICLGPVDYVKAIKVNDEFLKAGIAQTDGTLSINAPDFFGGEKREGGIVGDIDFDFGFPTQSKNSYLASKIYENLPAYRGVLSVILKQVYLGTNPYLKPWSFIVQRIHLRQEGLVQWYDSKSEIDGGGYITYNDYFRYKLETSTANPPSGPSIIGIPSEYVQENYDDSSWQLGQSAFGKTGGGGGNSPYENEPLVRTVLPDTTRGQAIWLRTTFFLENVKAAGDLEIIGWKNDGGWLFINGTRIDHIESYNYYNVRFVIPNKLLKPKNVLVYQMIEGVASPDGDFTGSPGASIAAIRMIKNEINYPDINPIHVIRECLTDPDWGMDILESDIDDTNFQQVADTIYNEGLGISMLWDRQIKIEEFILEILRHIDGVLYLDRKTAKFKIKLLRDDYDVNSIKSLDENDIISVEEYVRISIDEVTPSVTVIFQEVGTSKDTTILLEDTALINEYGNLNSTTIRYPGFSNYRTASIAVNRDLKALSTTLLNAKIIVKRSAFDLNIGDVFKLYWSDFHNGYIVMRVKNLDFGDHSKNQIKIECTEDIFSTDLGDISFVRDYIQEVYNPIVDPQSVEYALAQEAPYYELVFNSGQENVDSALLVDSSIGYATLSCYHTLEGGYINGTFYVDSGAGYDEIDQIDFAPVAFLNQQYSLTDIVFYYSEFFNYDDVVLGSHGYINGEIVSIVSIDTVNKQITVHRGCLDTIPKTGNSNSVLLVYSDYSVSDEIEYLDSETINLKITTATGKGEQDISEATAYPITFNSRAIRPYPPGNLKVNNVLLPTSVTNSFDVTWSHRDRTQQTASHFAYTTGNVGPETNTTYNIKLKYSNGDIVDQATGLTGTSWSPSSINTVSDLLTLELESSRDGFLSFEKYILQIQFDDTNSYTPNESFLITDSSYTPSNDFNIS